jgi:endonuclease/exonuclease/phosphatase family metal-dependent hydrolase
MHCAMSLIRIATFNVENLDDAPRHSPSLAERTPVLRRELAQIHADILCLQEVGAQRRHRGKTRPREFIALDALIMDSPYAGYARAVSGHRDGHGPMDVHNLVILSRFPIESSCQYWHDLVAPTTHALATPDPVDPAPLRIEWDRPVLHATVALPSAHRLHVLNVHLRAPIAAFIPGQKLDAATWSTTAGWAEGFYLAALKRTGQALECRLAVDRIFAKEPNALIAVCGDMNAEISEMPLRILRGDTADTGNPALGPGSLTPIEDRVAALRRYSVIHSGRPLMLDHILVSTALRGRLRDAEVFNRHLPDEASSAATSGSSHAPLVASFDL